ncbi:MAG: hypothetical protein ABR598_08440 [Candidatus Dormibacteria bacterium]
MTRQQVGWALVALAGILLLVQLVPAVASAGRSKPAPRVAALPREGGPTAPTSDLPAVFRVTRLAPTEQGLMIDRTASGRDLEIVSWQGALDGRVQLPAREDSTDGWGLSQSPDGSRLLDGVLLLDIDGRLRDLSRLIQQPNLYSFTWRDDSAGACALQLESDGVASLVEFAFNRGQAELTHYGLPADFGASGQLARTHSGVTEKVAPTILACSRATRTAVVGIVDLVGAAHVVIVDLVTGAEVGRREYPAGSASGLVGSRDGRLIALNGGRAQSLQAGPVPHTVVRKLDDGRVVRDFGSDQVVRSFSSDNLAVLVDSPTRAGTSVVRLRDGAPAWSDTSDRQLLGWIARPLSSEFALALGRRDTNTCTRGEPGKFPQFCRFQRAQDLVVASPDGSTRALGHGLGVWGYQVP